MTYTLTVKKHYKFKTREERDLAAEIAKRDIKGAKIVKSKKMRRM